MTNASSADANNLIWNGMFWNQLIYPEYAVGAAGGQSAPDAAPGPGGKWPDYAACLSVVGKPTEAERVAGAIAEALPPERCARLGFTHTNCFYFCGTSGGASIESLIASLDRARCAAGPSATLGLAFLRTRDTAGLREAAQHAVVAQRRKVRQGGGTVYVYEKSFLARPFSVAEHRRLSDRLTAIVRDADESDASDVLSRVLSEIFRENYLSLGHLRPLLQSDIVLMAQAALEAGADESDVSAESHARLVYIAETFDYADLRQIVLDSAARFIRLVRDQRERVSGRLVARVESFVKTNLADPDLALHKIAEIVGVNASYLSRRFKQEKGIGLTSYIGHRRVEQAQRLLLNTSLSIADIAFEIGFGSTQAFGRVFRAAVGCSPSAYRKARAR